MTEHATPTTAELLRRELDTVTGDRCGWLCEHHRSGPFPDTGCERAPGHTGAQVIVDVHVGRQRDQHGKPTSELITATATCCDGAP